MQFQNAVITPQGRAMLGAANTDKPIKWTRFLFSSSPTRLTGQETELPEPTWGDGSVDAVVAQTELEQFVIYASATNNTDSGYACSYGVFAEQDGVEQLVAVANCLGDPTHVTGSSEGYTRFHLALTIKYGVNASVISVEPNIAGLISRGEFEAWTERVVTTTSPSGAPYGEQQTIYGVKQFRDMVAVGAITDRANIIHFGDYGIAGSVLPVRAPNVNIDLGSSESKWENLYVENVYTDWIGTKRLLVFKGDKLTNLDSYGETVNFDLSEAIHVDSIFRGSGETGNWLSMRVRPDVINRYKAITYISRVKFLLDTSSSYYNNELVRITLRLVGGKEHPYRNTLIFETMMSLCTKNNGEVEIDSPNWWPIGGHGSSSSDSIICNHDVNDISPRYVILELERLV